MSVRLMNRLHERDISLAELSQGLPAEPTTGIDRLSDALIQKLRATDFDGPSNKYTNEKWRAVLAEEDRGRDAVRSGE